MSNMRFAKVLQRSPLLLIATSFAVVVGFVPASSAQNSQSVDHGKPTGTGKDAEERPDETSDGPGPGDRKPVGVQVAVPIGRVNVGPQFVDGQPIYVRRSTVGVGMTIVELSATPFAAELRPGEDYPERSALIVNPKEPLGW